jgi:hypothetical protein
MEQRRLAGPIFRDERGPHAGLAFVGEVEGEITHELEVLHVQPGDVHAGLQPLFYRSRARSYPKK